MKPAYVPTLVAALFLGLPAAHQAAETTSASGTSASAAQSKKSSETPAVPAKTRPYPMNSRVDSIDAANKTFITRRKKDGVEIKHVLPATAEIRNNSGPAKFSDIKVGDWVAGSRIKKSETEYEIVRITKFGPKATKSQ